MTRGMDSANNTATEKTMTNYTAPTFGSRYDSNASIDIADIAKRIRAEIKLARKAGALHVGKVSVRIERFSMGQAIRVEVKELAPTCGALYSVTAEAEEKETGIEIAAADYLTPARKRIDGILEGIVNAWNYDRSDSMTDYFDVNYYTTIGYDGELLRAERAEAARLADELLGHEAEHEAGADWADAYWMASFKADLARSAARYVANLADSAADVTDDDERARQVGRLEEEIARAERLAVEADELHDAWTAAVEADEPKRPTMAPTAAITELLTIASARSESFDAAATEIVSETSAAIRAEFVAGHGKELDLDHCDILDRAEAFANTDTSDEREVVVSTLLEFLDVGLAIKYTDPDECASTDVNFALARLAETCGDQMPALIG